ncbi:MAG: SIS domain-containing protein [Patescibacteria group bacterium]
MVSLDSQKEIRKIDAGNVLDSITELPDQCGDAWEKTRKINVPENFKDITNIIMCGMGGSGLGARIIESVYHQELNYPLIRVNDFDLPRYADHHSLVICSSYSGTTEEIINCARQAIDKNCKWMAIGTGKTLLDLAKEHNAPFYKIYPKYNPSNQPRMAIGYSVVGQLALASKSGLFELKHEDIEKIVVTMKQVIRKNEVSVSESENTAKNLARKLIGRNIFYISSEHLVGAMHTVNNQLNENTKAFSADFQIPELNHHLLEGLKHPTENQSRLFFVFANSSLYSENITKRHRVTQDVVKKNKIDYFEFMAKSKEKLPQAFELIQFGAFVNFYLAMLYGQNPAPIPWVDYLKDKLSKS